MAVLSYANNALVTLQVTENGKGCDIGYALTINSCEGVDDVEACTVTALDAITAFAVSNPNGLLAEPSVFSGLSVPADRSVERITQPTSDQLPLFEANPFSRR